MRVLHISDLHLSSENEADCKLLADAMFKDVEAYAVEKPFDLVIFSGDLVAHGKADEYHLARELLLDPLVERLGLPGERIYIAPGNHDVDRDEIRQMIELGLANGLGTPEEVDRLLSDDAELAEATARIMPWRAFMLSTGFKGAEPEPESLTAISRLEIEGKSVGVAILNSAWRSTGDADKGQLLLGAQRAEEALREIADCEVRFAVVHHPLDWLQPFEADQMRTAFESQGFIVLSGHEHSSDPSARKSPRGEAIYFQAGCLYSHVAYPNAYFILDVDPHDRRVVANIRRWSKKTRIFDAATEDAPGGDEDFDLPSGGNFTDLGHPRFSTVKRMITDAAAELRVLPEDLNSVDTQPSSVEDILVEPRLLSVPYKEAQAVATIADGVGKHEINATEELIEKSIVLLSGDPQSGISSSLFWLLSMAYDRDATKMPAYMRLPESRLGTTKQSATLAKAASMFGYRAESGVEPDLLLAVDDIDPALGNKFSRLITFISENPQHRLILGCPSTVAPDVSAALSDAGIDHGTAYLAPFGKSQLRRLATTVNRGRDADLDRIYGLIRTQSLPQTPFTMLALIAVTTSQLTDPDDLNQSSLLEAFVNLLLGSAEFAEAEQLGMNYRKRVALLGELARSLYDRPKWSMPVPEVEAMFLKFFEDRALRISAGAVLRSLIARQLLASDGQSISFRHPALLQLFLGKWMLEKDEHKAEMLTDPAKNAEAIGHAAALRRSDRDLLNKVGDFAREAISAVSEKLPRREVDRTLEEFEAVDSWGGDYLDKTLAALPERRSPQELDAELDRWSEAFDLGVDKLERPALSTARELEKATMLLSDVLRSSDLVDDPELKKALFELATEGWILLIGLATAEDHTEGPIRAMMEEIIDELLDDEDQDLKDALGRFILLLMTFVTAAVAQAKLGAKSLISTIETCLNSEDFTDSATAMCLAVWIEANLDLPEWPERLDALLSRLPSETFLRNATVAIAVAKYRMTADEKIAGGVLDALAPHLVADSEPKQRNAAIANVKQSIEKSRRVYQGGLSIKGSPQAMAALPVAAE